MLLGFSDPALGLPFREEDAGGRAHLVALGIYR